MPRQVTRSLVTSSAINLGGPEVDVVVGSSSFEGSRQALDVTRLIIGRKPGAVSSRIQA